MKKIIFLIAIAVLSFSAGLQAQTKIGYTNVELILNYMPETEAIEKQMETLEKKLAEALEVKQKYYQQKLQEYMQAEQTGKLTDAQKQAAAQGLQGLEAEIQQQLGAAQQKLFAKRMEMLKPLQDKMQNAIDQVAKEEGYEYILNQAVGQGIPSIIYGDESHDVTMKIANKLGLKVE